MLSSVLNSPRVVKEILYCQVQFMVEEKDWASQGEEIDNHNIML